MRPQTMAAAFASVQEALDNCKKSGNTEWLERWRLRFAKLVDHVPTWSGMPLEPSDVEVTSAAIRYEVSYHHMNDTGYYDGWTEHTVVVRPAFESVDVRVSGRNRQDVKELIHEAVNYAFTRRVTWDEPAQRWTVESEGNKPRWTRSETGRDLLRDGQFMVSVSRATNHQGPQLSPSDTDTLSNRIAALLTEHGDGLAD